MENTNYSMSVIVCCYNPNIEKLKKTINSIYNQKGVVFEIIISDDGSKDIYKDTIERYFDEIKFKDYQLNFLPKNQGTVKNILSAVRIAKGKYIKTISPGDYFFDTNSLKSYYDSLENNHADLVFSRGAYYQDNKIMPVSAPYFSSVFKNKNLKRNIIMFNDYVLGAAIALKADLALEYFEEIKKFSKLLEDMPLIFMSLMDDKKVVAIDKFLVWYEYGFGISTGPHKEVLHLDYENCYKYFISKYNNSKIIRKSYNFYKLQFDGFIKNKFKKLLFSYDYIYRYIKLKLQSKKIYEHIDINDMNLIINIDTNKKGG